MSVVSLFLALSVSCSEVQVESKPTKTMTITLKGKTTVKKALDELCAQTGQGTATIALPTEHTDQEINLNWNNLSFWEALENVAKLTKTRIQTGERIRLVSLDNSSEPVSLSGPFRQVLQRITSSIDLNTGTRKTHAWIEIAWEPRLQPFLLETRPTNQTIKDDQEMPLAPIALGKSAAPVDGRFSMQIEVTLPTPARSANRFSMLEGQLHAIGPNKMAIFRFGLLDQLDSPSVTAEMLQRSESGLVCRISRLTLTPERWTIQVQVDTPAGGAQLESFQSWVVNNELVLQSADGKRKLNSSSYVVESVTERRATVSYNFLPKTPKEFNKPSEWQVTYTSPVAVITIPFRYRFRDIPLP